MLDIVNRYTDLPWLRPLRTELEQLLRTGRCPQALLVHGRRGTGRRQLALWLAEAFLGEDPMRTLTGSDERAGHPDLLTIEPEESKASIGIDQVRNLVDFFRLTSHGRNGRLALLWPAESMTINAANSLLKTLEEPPASSLIVLICESTARLPATIVSRCQRVRIPLPSQGMALDWLEAMTGSADLEELLDIAGGAPLAALQLYATKFADKASLFARDIVDLQQRRAIPLEIAARWSKTPDLALEWLSWRLAGELRTALGAPTDSRQNVRAGDQSRRIVHAGFRQLEQIRELRRLFKGGISTELSIAGLLMGWYGGLGHRQQD